MRRITIIAVALLVLVGGAAFVYFSPLSSGPSEQITPSDVPDEIETTNSIEASFNFTDEGVVYTGGELHQARTQFLLAQQDGESVSMVLQHDTQIQKGDVVITPAQMITLGEGGVDLVWKPYENENYADEWHSVSSLYISQDSLDNLNIEDATEYDESVTDNGNGNVTGIGDVELEVTEDGVMYYGEEIAERYDAGQVSYEHRGERRIVSDEVPQDETLLVEGETISSAGITPGSQLMFIFSPLESEQQYLGVVTIPQEESIIDGWEFMSADINVSERGFVYDDGTIDDIYESGGQIQLRYDGERTTTYDGVPESNTTIATPEQVTDIPVPPESSVRVEYSNGDDEYYLDSVETPAKDSNISEEWPYIEGDFVINANGLVYADGDLNQFDNGKLVIQTTYNRHTVYEGVPDEGETVAPYQQLRDLGVPLGQPISVRWISGDDVYHLGEYDMPSENETEIIDTWGYPDGTVEIVDDGIIYSGDAEDDFGDFEDGTITVDFASTRDQQVFDGIPEDNELVVDHDDIATYLIPPDTIVNVYFEPTNEDARLFIGGVTTPEAGSERGDEWGYGSGDGGSIDIDGIVDPVVGVISPLVPTIPFK